MSLSSTARLLSPEEIAVNSGEPAPFLRLPERASVFADRALRLRQLSAGHAMRDFLLFAAQLTEAQHAALQRERPGLVLPEPKALDDAARDGVAPLQADWLLRDAAWRPELRDLLTALLPRLANSPARPMVEQVAAWDDDRLQQQAERLLTGVMQGLDLGAAPLLAAGLQLHLTRLVLAVQQRHDAAAAPGAIAPFGRVDDATACPCCAGRPTASVTRIGADTSGFRYLHCSLCATQWHLVRIKCARCDSTKGITYRSLQPVEGRATPPAGAGRDAVQAECCGECGHYLKIVHMTRDPQVEPVADDLASLTLDLLVAEEGLQRHGLNLLLLFGDPEGDADDPGGG
ncbi:formate dehydrogenase accessory protein FdhE [Aquabacterium sp. J223]|uniref:formate dehydrogenase accessory protein FdhE n=1 Tax=Aquabacterium sp. J223 TaxID=2898431 RepID=UPI0021ADA655|nr:formate dehydrogenase accessory protein FdhE [Aquabacterium sp. J223]UUX94345.1 formate dehydrogenase accessory protein FdhE [Aquabacterium sp. J223]